MTNNQLAENSVTQLLNSVRLARDNAERADNRVDHSFYYALTIALEELQERRKADSEPVAYTDERNLGYIDRGRETAYLWGKQNSEDSDVALYRHAQPAPERDNVRREHAEWSQATFGNVGPIGPLKHLSKEALEAAAEPGDLSEWADMQFLLWDAQRRAGITDEQITQAMIEKLAVNKQREWPEPKDGEPRLHIKEQPAPTIEPVQMFGIGSIFKPHAVSEQEPDCDDCAHYNSEICHGEGCPAISQQSAQPAPVVQDIGEIRELVNQLRDVAIKYHGAGQLREQIARVVRAYMLQAEPDKSASKLPGVIDDNLVEGLRLLQCMLDDYRERNYGHAQDWVRHIDQRFSEYSETHGDDAYCILHGLLAGEGDSNPPVIPEGYVMVPKEPTEQMYDAGDRQMATKQVWDAMLAAAPQEVK